MEKEHPSDEERIFISNVSHRTLLVKACSSRGIEYYTVQPGQEVTLIGKDLKVDRIETEDG